MVVANRVHVQLVPRQALELSSGAMCPICLLSVNQTPLNLGMAGPPSDPMTLERAQIAHKMALVCQAQEDLFAGFKI